MTERLRLARASGEADKIEELEKKLKELESSQSKILANKGVDICVLTKAANCKVCGDSGIVGDKICECAFKLTDKIKAFNAAARVQ